MIQTKKARNENLGMFRSLKENTRFLIRCLSSDERNPEIVSLQSARPKSSISEVLGSHDKWPTASPISNRIREEAFHQPSDHLTSPYFQQNLSESWLNASRALSSANPGRFRVGRICGSNFSYNAPVADLAARILKVPAICQLDHQYSPHYVLVHKLIRAIPISVLVSIRRQD
jgi:hypothetical protein